jgi:hypothetical protein
MLTEVISKLDRAVLELALIDAFTDMCFYEGEEFTAELEKYLSAVDSKTNTEEQDAMFFDIAMPYIESSIMVYGREIYEGLKPGGPKDSANTKGEGLVGGELTKVINPKGKDEYLEKAGLKTPPDAKKGLTEAEEVAVWEGLGETIYPAAKAGLKRAKNAIVKTGKSLSAATTSGITAAAKNFKKNLSGFKLPKGEVPNTSNKK